MKYLILLLVSTVLLSCTENKSVERDNPAVDIDNYIQTEKESADIDETDESDRTEPDTDTDQEKPDIDMYCPYPMNAGYPYYREDGTIHFCRPCDTPDEYDPQCVKSLWKDLNKEVYDTYIGGGFEDNEYIKECYPWPCEWKVEPIPNELVPSTAHQKCDIFLNPHTWANDFAGSSRLSVMNKGKIVMTFYNYRYADINLECEPGRYNGKRTALYDISSGKYSVIGKSSVSYINNDRIIIKPYISIYGEVLSLIVEVLPYKDSYRYNIIYTDDDTNVSLDSKPFITDKWTIMVVNHLDAENDPVGAGNRELIYSKTGEWKWTTLVSGYPDGKAGEISIAGDNAIFAHEASNTSYICNLSKSPKSLSDCKKISRDGEAAGFPRFDQDNPNRIVYRSIVSGEPTNKIVVLNISKEPWTVEKEFQIPSTEEKFLSMWLMQFQSNLILYEENYLLDASGYQEDGKLCFYRIDKEKAYCSKPIEGQKDYGHGYANFEGKHLFWQPMYKAGYILRDMDCYCKEEDVCPFEE